MLEREVEQYVVNYAVQRGVLVLKLNTTGNRGWPDRVFLFERGRVLFIEFKAPNARPRRDEVLQKHVAENLRRKGYMVEWCANKEYGKELIDQHLKQRR